MRYFKINIQGNELDEKLATVDLRSDNIQKWGHCMALGEPVSNHYPEKVEFRLQDYPGFQLRSVLGNIFSYFLVDTKMKEAIESLVTQNIEFFPFTLINHKGKVHSKDYWIINPLGTHNVLDIDHSKVSRGRRTGEIVDVEEYAFSANKLKNAPHLFRLKDFPSQYFASEKLVSLWKQNKSTNIYLTEVQIV